MPPMIYHTFHILLTLKNMSSIIKRGLKTTHYVLNKNNGL